MNPARGVSLPSTRRMLVMLLVRALGVTAYGVTRFKRDFVDFEVMQQAGGRPPPAAPLLRAGDCHLQYKSPPASARAITRSPPADTEVAKPIWFALSVGLL